MNFLDVILIIIIAVLTMLALVLQFMAARDEEWSMIGGVFVTWLVLILCIGGPAWFRLDKKSGTTVGTITSVDKNFFGTTALYIKTTETTEEEYCIEDNGLAEIAKENIGKKVRINYGTRVGLYSTGACSDAPVEIIAILNEEKYD